MAAVALLDHPEEAVIEQPKKQAGPETTNRFHTICECGKMLIVDTADRRIPEHSYWINGMWGAAGFFYRCDRSGRLHGT